MQDKFKIVVATDYSRVAENAQRYAFQFAHEINAILYLLHIYEIPFSSTPASANEFIDTKNDYKSHELSALEHQRGAMFNEFNFNEKEFLVECIVKSGKTGKQIRHEAADVRADFIVVGTHGAGKFREAFLGSHTWDVIKKSGIPVIAVPEKFEFKPVKNIVFGSEFREGEIPVVNYLVHLAKRLGATLTLLHIVDNKISKEQEDKLMRDFKEQVEKEITYHLVDYRVAHYDNVVDGLNDFCLRTNADLLAMSPERSSALKLAFNPTASLTRKMTFHTHIPILAIPDYYNPDYSKFWNLFKLQKKFEANEY